MRPLPEIPPAVNQLHLEKRKGGTGTRLWVEDLAGYWAWSRLGSSRSTHGVPPPTTSSIPTRWCSRFRHAAASACRPRRKRRLGICGRACISAARYPRGRRARLLAEDHRRQGLARHGTNRAGHELGRSPRLYAPHSRAARRDNTGKLFLDTCATAAARRRSGLTRRGRDRDFQ